MTPPSEDAAVERQIRARAVRRVAAKLSLYWHLAVFVMANAAMLAINLIYAPDQLWFLWPLCAWSAALVLHAFAVFQVRGMGENMIQAEIERERAQRTAARDEHP